MIQNILDKHRSQIHMLFMAMVIAFIYATSLPLELKAIFAALPAFYFFYCFMEITTSLRDNNETLHRSNTETYTNEYGETWED